MAQPDPVLPPFLTTMFGHPPVNGCCELLEDLGATLELDFALLEDFAEELDFALLEDLGWVVLLEG